MNIALPLFAIGLVFGGGIGFVIAAANGITLDGHDHAEPGHHGGAHSAQTHAAHQGAPVDIPASQTAPTLALDLVEDPSAGWNLHMRTTNFRFSPQNASRAHVEGEGHAHVYVNDVKLGRFYGDWVHLDKLPDGPVTVRVTLNANDHRPLSVAGKPLAQEITIPE